MYAKQVGGANNFFYPVNQFSSSGMDGDVIGQYVNPNYQEIQSQTAINTEYGKFASGPLIYNVDCSNNYGIRFATSFFRIDATLQGPLGLQPTLNDQIAFSRFFGGNIFQASSVAVSNQTISQCQNYHGQINALNSRLSYSGSFLYNNSDLLYSEPDLRKRINKIASNSINNINTFLPIPYELMPFYSNAQLGSVNAVRISVAATVAGNTVLTLIVPDLGAINEYPTMTANILGIVPGTVLYRYDANNVVNTYIVNNVNTVAGPPVSYTIDTTATTPEGAPVNNIVLYNYTTQTGFEIYRPCDISTAKTGQNNISVLFQPPQGIYSITEALCGSFTITLNPSPDYLTQGIQSMRNTLNVGTDYRLIISNVRFYANVVRMTFSPERTIKLRLIDMEMYNKAITGQNQTYQITVPPSSRAFAICFQGNNVGRNGSLILSPSEYRSIDGKTSQLISLQCTYGNISIPSTNYQTNENNNITVLAGKNPEYVGESINSMRVRYFDYLASTGKIFSESGAEKFEDWIQSPFYIFDFSNSENSRSTNLDISVNFREPVTTDTQLLCCAFYSRVCTGTYRANILSELNVGNV